MAAALYGFASRRLREDDLIDPQSGKAIEQGHSADRQWQITPLSVRRSDGVVLRGAHFTRPQAQATVLYFGGNGQVLREDYPDVLASYQNLPVNVIAFDHRGYAGSRSKRYPCMDALNRDGVAIFDAVQGMGSTIAQPVIVHGLSLGSFVAGFVAAHRPVAGLLLEGSATTAKRWKQLQRQRLPLLLRAFAPSELESDLRGVGSLPWMPSITAPLLVLVGEKDITTPPAMSRALFDAAATPDAAKELVIAKGADHVSASHSAEFAPAFGRLLQRAKRA